MRNLTADFILTPTGQLVPGLTLRVQDDGTIINLIKSGKEPVEYYPGIICPAFINSHLHLELSGFKNKISPDCGLDGFISQLVHIRSTNSGETNSEIDFADMLMWNNGIQAAGDICNTPDTLNTKKNSNLRYHSFIELFEFNSSKSREVFDKGLLLAELFLRNSLQASIVPHAPYSVPPELFSLIADHSDVTTALWTIHNQESEAENLLFQNATGSLKVLFTGMGIKAPWQIATGKNSVISTAGHFPVKSHLMLVHNTYTSQADITYLSDYITAGRIWFCLCPNANLFIENKLPDIIMLKRKGCKLIIGTDSLASNNTLSILDEIKTLHKYYPDIPVEELLTWATSNAADYFNWSDLGRFHPGNHPGIICISDSGPDTINAGKIKRLA